MEARMAQHMSQFTIALPADLRAFIDRIAADDGRTLSGWCRVAITEAAKRAGYTNGAGATWPPPMNLPQTLEAGREELARASAELDKLNQFEQRGGANRTGLLPHQDEQRRFLRDRVRNLQNFVAARERIEAAR
jgi:hypothetical protein